MGSKNPSKSPTVIEKLDRNTVHMLLDEIQCALQPVADKYGMALSRRRGSYTPDSMPILFELAVHRESQDGTKIDANGIAFQRYAESFGLRPSDLHRNVTIGPTTYKIVGLKPTSSRYPILALHEPTGKTYKFPAEVIRAVLAREASKP